MIVRPVYPEPGSSIDTRSPDARARLAALYPPPALRLNMVASVDGGSRDGSGTSAGLSVGADRAILGAIRSVSDTVLVGAETLRREPDLLPRTAHLTVVSGSGDFAGIPVPDVEPGRILVVGPGAAEGHARETLAAPFDYLAVEGGLAEVGGVLRERYGRIVCEGGPILSGALVGAGLVDEVCLTTSPMVGGAGGPILPGPIDPRGLELRQLLVDDTGAVYARWGVRN